MSFLWCRIHVKKFPLKILSNYKHGKKTLLKQYSLNFPRNPANGITGRISPHTLRASITLEAAVVLPLFLFFCLTLTSVLNQYRTYSALTAAVQQVGNIISVENQILLSGQIEDKVTDALSQQSMDSVSYNVENLLYFGGKVSFRLSYREEPLMNLWGIRASEKEIAYSGHQWTGFDLNLTDERDGEEYVFVTETGSVYHRSRNCTHLKLSITSAPLSTVSELRNGSGGKYYPCERCGTNMGGMVYLTTEGNRYHGTIECSGLRRNIRTIPLSEAIGYRPCSRCGG